MRYQDWIKETEHVSRQADAMRKASEREYVIREGSTEWGVDYAKRQIKLRVSVYSRPDSPPQLSFCIDVFGSGSTNQIGDLTPNEFRRIADIREVYQEWIDGKRMALPDVMPWETVA